MPACANITALNLMLKPIFRMPGDSSSGRNASSASSAFTWSGARPAENRPAPSLKLFEAANGLVFAAVDPGLARRFGAGGGERDRGEGLSVNLAALRHARSAAPPLKRERWGGG